MVRVIIVIIFCCLKIALYGQDFKLMEPDTLNLRAHSHMISYHYLRSNYKLVTSKEFTDQQATNSFCSSKITYTFENEIEYSVWECEDAPGHNELISFPQIKLPEIKKFVEKLFYNPLYSWWSETEYGAGGAGCNYKIKQTENRTIIDIYCGC